ncbi:MAG: hypothetical protein ACRDPY_42750 [Streptosporangiaceae bacterium]
MLDPAIRPLGTGEVIAGAANPFLVAEVDEIPAEPYTGEIAALDDIRPGEVILVAAGGSARAAGDCTGAGDVIGVGVGTPQMKFAYGTGGRFGGGGTLKQCDSSHRTRGSGPSGDTGRMNSRT